MKVKPHLTSPTKMTKEKEYIIINRKKQIRCPEPRCNKMFMLGELASGTKIEVKCPRCKTLCRYHKL